jgi:ADP-ribose pyrophosphatase YjhB (NUDIX family)
VGVQDGWRFCPRCAGSLAPSDEGALACAACGSSYYAHSMPTANAIVVDEVGRVLLGRRAREPEQGKWDVLGGFVHEGEHPEVALRRELREETGLEVEPERFLGTWIDDYGAGEGAVSTLNLAWTARVLGGTMAAADDVAELRWFAEDELPAEDECAFHCVHAMLSAWRQQQA